MKIQCDVCNVNEASVYCVADEASLCSVCDQRVHHANKLAVKHARFSLQHPSPKEAPLCDICQEKKAFLFCQQDRAILCKDCDASIHQVNQHTMNHNRFLLTGVKLSPTACLYSSSTDPVTQNGVVPDQQQKQDVSQIMNQPCLKTINSQVELIGSGHGSSTSSISEYLIETLPGWHVEDFLDQPTIFSKVDDNDMIPIWEGNLLDGSMTNNFSSESTGIWVPQAPPSAPAPPTLRYGHVQQQFKSGSHISFGDKSINGSTIQYASRNFNNNNHNNISNGTKSRRKLTMDNRNCFAVPQISPPSTNSKRSRTLWH